MTRAVTQIGRGCRTARDPKYFETGPAGTPGNHLIEVFLDGVRCPTAVMAHAGKGWVTVRVLDADGNVATDGLGRSRFATLHGKVELRKS